MSGREVARKMRVGVEEFPELADPRLVLLSAYISQLEVVAEAAREVGGTFINSPPCIVKLRQALAALDEGR